MMKNLIKKKGVASIEELRHGDRGGVKMIACQMTMELFAGRRERLSMKLASPFLPPAGPISASLAGSF